MRFSGCDRRKEGPQQRPHLHFILSEVDDRESLPDDLPVVLVVDGGDFGTLALGEGQSWVVSRGALELCCSPGGTRPAHQLLTFTRYR